MERSQKMSCKEAISALHSGIGQEKFRAAAHINSCAECQVKIAAAQNPTAALKKELSLRLGKR